jgi:hypothetical protein
VDWSPIASALEALAVEWFQPLNVVLLVGLVMFARYMHKANQRNDFDLVDALRGPDGKASMKLIGYLVALIFGTWALMNCAAAWVQQPATFVQIFAIYVVLLIAPKIAAEWIQAKYTSPKRDDDKGRPHVDDH